MSFITFYLLWQGEKGEPGVTIAADGSILSAPKGPRGLKGPKVLKHLLSTPKMIYFLNH